MAQLDLSKFNLTAPPTPAPVKTVDLSFLKSIPAGPQSVAPAPTPVAAPAKTVDLSFLKSIPAGTQSVAPTPSLGAKVISAVKAYPQFARDVTAGASNMAQDSARSSLRVYSALGTTFAPSIPGVGLFVHPDPYMPTSEFSKALYGTDQPITGTSVGNELPFVKKDSKLSPILGLGVGALDLIPGGSAEKKGLRALLDDFSKFLPKKEGEVAVSDLSKLAHNSLENAPVGVRPASIAAQGDAIKAGQDTGRAVEVRMTPEGKLDIVDGRHYLQAAIDQGKPTIRVKNVTEDYFPKLQDSLPSALPSAKAIDAGAKERGFITSAKKAFPENPGFAGDYTIRNTDELAIKARTEILHNPEGALSYARTHVDDKSVAIVSELMKKYAHEASLSNDVIIKGDLSGKAAELANLLAPKLTEAGRTVQAASIISRLTPEGQLRFAAREIQRFNEANPTKKIPDLTGPQAQYIIDEMKGITAMADGEEKLMRFHNLQQHVTNLVPTPLMNKIVTIWKAGLLTGLKTHGVNIASNVMHGLTETAKDIPTAAVDILSSVFTGKRTMNATLRGVAEGVKEGLVKGKRYFSSGFDERNIGTKLEYNRVNFGTGKVAKIFQGYTDTVFRTLGAADQPSYYVALRRSIMDQSLAEAGNRGLKGKARIEEAYKIAANPSEDQMKYALLDATTAVFQNQTKLGQMASKIQNSSAIGQIIIPFARTPSSVAMQIIAYSPVGLAKTIIENIGKGRFDQRLFSQGMGRGLTGTAVMAVGAELYKKGLISLDYPVGDERAQRLQEAQGVKSNSIKFLGGWRSPSVLGPGIGNILILGANVQKFLEQKGSPADAAINALLATGHAFTDQTFVQGMTNFTDFFKDPLGSGKAYIANLTASTVPTIISDVARASDAKERLSSASTFGGQVKNSILSRIPGARQTLQPKVDILGREIPRIGNPLEVMADPTRPSPDRGTPVTTELARLYAIGHKVSPTLLGDKAGYKTLTPHENTYLWEKTGVTVNKILTNLFTMPSYHTMPADLKAKLIEKVVQDAKNQSRAIVIQHAIKGLSPADRDAKLAEYQQDGVLTRDVMALVNI